MLPLKSRFQGEHKLILRNALNNRLFFSKYSPDYFEELFFPTEETAIQARPSFQKLNIPRRKTNIGLKSLSYTGPSL